jgi:predicted lipid-binding transport protein (Tim44 family)
MKGLTIALVALLLGLFAPADDAQAARLGGGRSLGAQRQITPPPKQANPPAQQREPAGAPQPSGPGRWLGPLAGLAAGLGLGWLFAQGGFGSAIGVLLMALLAGVLVVALTRLFARGRPQGSQLQYSGFGDETVPAPPPSQLPGDAGVRPDFRSQFVPNIPASFDVDGFLKEARRNFLRLQDANDRGDLVRLRQVTTREMFDALRDDARGRSRDQQTDVVRLDASLLELVTEGDLHWASVRFSGSIREEPTAAAEPFEEIWNLCKPVSGSSGWLLAGIQQTH